MLADKIAHYKTTGKMLNNTPAQYKKEYTFLKEVDSLALANVQMNLNTAYKNFFQNPKTGFPRFKSKHRNQNSYTTNVVNGNILEYKLREQGKKLIKIDRFYPSSKKCSCCGLIKAELPLSERVYRCECGLNMDRDKNAAINIREEAKRMMTA